MLSPEIRYTPRVTPSMRALKELPARLRDFSPLMRQGIAPAAVEMLRRHWDSKGEAFGHPWAALADSTIAAKVRKGTAGKGPLRDSDNLFLALFKAVAEDSSVKAVPGGARLSLGLGESADPLDRLKAIWHQRGTEVGGAPRMPARQIIPDPLPRSFRDLVRSMVRDWLLTGRLRGAGGRFVSVGAG